MLIGLSFDVGIHESPSLRHSCHNWNAHLRSSTRRDHRGVDLISDVLPFGRLWFDTPDNAIGYAMHSSRSHDAVIRVYDEVYAYAGSAQARAERSEAQQKPMLE
jgi:hypothetical protein